MSYCISSRTLILELSRISDKGARHGQQEIAACLLDRNTHNVKANWRFTAADARIKLKSLYPAL
jgi:hypothetical protein